MLKPFLDPVLFAPTLGSMLMCLASSLVGVLVFVRKRSLLGETLSHAAYPGVIISLFVTALFFAYSEELIAIVVLVGALITSLLGLYAIDFLKRKFRIYDDAALTFILASFLGVGILFASHIQQSHALWYRQSLLFLYGQVATMREGHVVIYGVLALLVVLFVSICYHSLLSLNFDRIYSRSIGMRTKLLDMLTFWLLAFAIVIGIRSVGVILMSGMLIAPAIAAKALTHKLSKLLFLAALFGVLSAYLGNLITFALPLQFAVPTGPAIVLVATGFALLSLLFAPEEGLVNRFLRVAKFARERRMENILKLAWKKGQLISAREVIAHFPLNALYLKFFFQKMVRQGWLSKETKGVYRLTEDGVRRAERIVRLHRLWEVYLFDFLGVSSERVHGSACEMEHIITPELEDKLSLLLGDPKTDPHAQPIPSGDRL